MRVVVQHFIVSTTSNKAAEPYIAPAFVIKEEEKTVFSSISSSFQFTPSFP
jgi:hypothetical protein